MKKDKAKKDQSDDLVPRSMLPDDPKASFPKGYLENREKKSSKVEKKAMGGRIDGCAVRGLTRA
jgi:hypothetical protein